MYWFHILLVHNTHSIMQSIKVPTLHPPSAEVLAAVLEQLVLLVCFVCARYPRCHTRMQHSTVCAPAVAVLFPLPNRLFKSKRWPYTAGKFDPTCSPSRRYSVVLKGDCLQLGGAKQQVAIKVYEKPSLTSKKQKMATREAIVLKYLNSQG